MLKTKPIFCLLIIILHFIAFQEGFAQLISIKTVPLATGNQFMMFPSKTMGAGNLSLAIDDSWADPFSNPAKGVNLKRSYFFSLPTMYKITGNNGSARSLPVGALYTTGKWFGGALLNIQELEPADLGQTRFNLNSSYKKLDNGISDNIYSFGSVGKYFSKMNTSIGMSFFYANLNAVEGIELLYPQSEDINQSGKVYDLRAGLFHKTSDEQEIEAVVLHSRYDMTYDVYHQDWGWNDVIEDDFFTERIEKNFDKSRTWGVHLGYVKPLPNSNWRFGSILTGNWKSHPKIPNYELMNIPRDPGNSWAYNLGIGFANVDHDTSFGFEIIYEPIWTNTWADAATEEISRSGRIIAPGKKTIENDFSFSNWIMRLGLSKDAFPFGFQLGLQLQSIRYRLNQYNYIEEFRRKLRENWYEWMATWGFMIDFKTFELKYDGRLLIGTGRPGVDSGITLEAGRLSNADKNILLAPGGNLVLDDAVVFTHRFTVVIPLGHN